MTTATANQTITLDELVATKLLGYTRQSDGRWFYTDNASLNWSSFVPRFSAVLEGHALQVNRLMLGKDHGTNQAYRKYLRILAIEDFDSTLDLATVLFHEERFIARIICQAALLAIGVDEETVRTALV